MSSRWLKPFLKALGRRRIGVLDVRRALNGSNRAAVLSRCSADDDRVRLCRRNSHPIGARVTPRTPSSRASFSTDSARFTYTPCASGWKRLLFSFADGGSTRAGQFSAGGRNSRTLGFLQLWPRGHQLQHYAGAAVAVPSRSRRGRGLSSTSDASSKSPDKSSDAEPVMVGTVEAEVEAVPETKADDTPGTPAVEEPRHSHIQMPSIVDDEKLGIVTSWNVNVGDSVEAGDVVCEIELEQFSVGVKVETSGFVAEILVNAGSKKIPVGEPIATVVHSVEDIEVYLKAQEALGLSAPDTEPEHAEEGEGFSFSWKDVLKNVSRLSQDDNFSQDDASTLMSLARHKDGELLQAFDGCFEGTDYKGEIDDDLFLMQGRDIARTRRKEADKQKVDGT